MNTLPGRPTVWITVGQDAGGGCLDFFSLGIISLFFLPLFGVVGWCDGSRKTSSAEASYNLHNSRARAYCTCSRCGWGCLDIFTVIYPFFPLSPSLWERARYRLKYCLKGPLNPKQPTKFSLSLGDGPI